MRYVPLFLAAAVGAAVCGCTPTIKTESEVTIKPVQIDLNVNLKVDKELTQALSPDSKPDLKADPNSSDVRERRRARRDQIKAFKSAQLLGENNKGLLEVRTENGKVTDQVRKVMEAENSDRRLVFEVVAQKQNSTPEFVAQRWRPGWRSAPLPASGFRPPAATGRSSPDRCRWEISTAH